MVEGPEAGEQQPTEREELLATKFIVPQVRTGSLARPRLLADLTQAVTHPLTVVCAPAGFGKTMLLADWALRSDRPVAWLSLDPDDDDPVCFWRYVVAALVRAGIRVGERVSALVTRPDLSSGHDVVSALVNELVALPEDVVLVLDDYDALDSKAIHDGVGLLLGYLPPPLHLIIASRSDPPLHLARLRASGQLAELRATDLRFTADESAAFLRETFGLDLSPQSAAEIESRTEGWVVGLQLAALSLREHPDVDAFLATFTGSHRFVLDYMSEEVLARQPDRVGTFLMQTSILHRLNGPLCDAVTGGSDGQAMLEDLERTNLFVISLDEERRWYRLHHLFGEFLRARLRQSHPEVIPELHRRAAFWSEQHGLLDEAIRHSSKSGDAQWASRLVEEHLDGRLSQGEETIVARWLSALPEEVVRSVPKLCLAQAYLDFHLGDLASVERLLNQADTADLDQEGTSGGVPTTGGLVAEFPAAIALLRAEVAAARGDFKETAQQAGFALARTSDREHGPRFWARWLQAFAEWMRGDVQEAERAFFHLLEEGRSAPSLNPLMSTGSTLASVQRARGNLGAALRTYREGLRFVTEGGQLSVAHAGELHLGLSRVLYERDELMAALEHVTVGIDLSRYVMMERARDRGLVTLAWIRQAMGETDRALEAMDQACRMYPSTDATSLFNPAPAERARLWVAIGRIEEATRWTEERGLSDMDGVTYLREAEHLVLARVLLAQAHATRASRLLERLDTLADAQGREGSLIEIRALRSLALQANAKHQAALELLEDALSMARPEGYVRVFADEGPLMAALIQRFIRLRREGRGGESNAAGQHALRVARSLRLTSRVVAGSASTTGELVEPLTTREIEVLELIAVGRRNREIADELVVTLDTVKRHVSHIFGKLGTVSRTEAVAVARELHLIR
jgi:ATP/maltotriose-dependent transcriptional regulator MalT